MTFLWEGGMAASSSARTFVRSEALIPIRRPPGVLDEQPRPGPLFGPSDRATDTGRHEQDGGAEREANRCGAAPPVDRLPPAPSTPKSRRCRAPRRQRSRRGPTGPSSRGAPTGPGPSLGPEADLLGERAALLRIARRHHRIVVGQPPPLAILLGRHVVARLQMPFQHLELFAVLQTNNVLRR